MEQQEREAIVERLSLMPERLAELVERLADGAGGMNPDPPGLTLVEHVWHLADLEEEAYAVRIRRIREEDGPVLADFDGGRLAAERQYRLRDIGDGLLAFGRARSANVATLRQVSANEWARSATQDQVGPLTLDDVPRMMDEHDTSHRQDLEQLVAGCLVLALGETPSRLRRIVSEFTLSALRRPPSTKPRDVEAFSAIGHLCHLRDIEIDGYHVRIHKLRTEDRPTLYSLPGEQLAVERAYDSADPEVVLSAFEEARGQTLDAVRSVGPQEWSLAGEFEGYGLVTLLRLVEILVEHDAGHLAALAQMPRR
jgi:hypothetical protein